VREEEPIAACLEQGEVDERRPCLPAEPGSGQVVHLGEYQRRHDDRPRGGERGLAADALRGVLVGCGYEAARWMPSRMISASEMPRC
jgi:hypothetical protein